MNQTSGRPVDLRKSEVLSDRTFIGHAGHHGQAVRLNGGMSVFGPVLITVRVERTDGCRATADGWHRSTYSVLVDGVHQYGGEASHLVDGMPPFGAGLTIGDEILFSALWTDEHGDRYETSPMPSIADAMRQAHLALDGYRIPAPVAGITVRVSTIRPAIWR